MKFRRIVAALVVSVLAWVSFGGVGAVALEGGDTIAPQYLYARMVEAYLKISGSGYATCSGQIRAKAAGSDISMKVTLYRQSGEDWIRVTGWEKSGAGTSLVEISKTVFVDKGTYKVVVTGKVTLSNGSSEDVRDTSDVVTY